MGTLRDLAKGGTGTQTSLRDIARQPEPVRKPVTLNKGMTGTTSQRAGSQALGTASLRNLLLEKGPPKKPSLVSRTVDDVKAVGRGEVSAMDFIKSVPGGVAKVARGLYQVPKTVFPAVVGGVETTGNIFGEGLAYATDKEVRKQYEAGNTDILPTITKTTQKDLAKKVIASGIEASIFKYFPQGIKQAIYTRGGLGAIEGLGFAITEGMAKDETVEEIIQKLPTYMTTGALANVIAPYLGRILTAQIGSAPKEVKDMFKKLNDEPSKAGGTVTPPKETPSDKFVYATDEDLDVAFNKKSRGGQTPEQQREVYDKYMRPKVEKLREPKPDEEIIFYQPTEGSTQYVNTRLERSLWENVDDNFRAEVVKKDQLTSTGFKEKDAIGERLLVKNAETSPTQTVEVPRSEMPVGLGEQKASRLAERLSVVDDPNVPTYKTSNQKESIAKAEKYFEGKLDEALDVLEGKKPMPKDLNIETNALLPVVLSKTGTMSAEQLVRTANARNIRSLVATRAGQEISILQKVDPDNPINAMADIIKVREDVFTRRNKGVVKEKAIKAEAKSVKKETTAKQLKIQEAESILNSILC